MDAPRRTTRHRDTVGRSGPFAAATALAISVVLATVALLAVPASADPSSDKQRVDRQISQTEAELEAATDKARQAVIQYNQASAALPAAQAKVAEAKGRVVGAQSAARQAEREAAAARTEAATAEAEYQQAAAEVDRARREVSDFISAAYRGSSFVMLNNLLEAPSPADLINRIGYLDQVADSQQRALAELTGARTVARQRSSVAVVKRDTAERSEAAARKALDDALAAQAAAEQAAAQLAALAQQQQSAAAAAESERGAVLARYNELKAQSDRLAAELRNAAGNDHGGGDVPSGDSGGYLRMPVSGWKSSNFGMRYDPYYHVWQLHAGTDFAAGGGTPIVAAATGRVVRTGMAGGYGNYTCVYHGKYQGHGLSTCYAHQSAILVSVGQNVQRGQVIGRVGSTGGSTGNHLHFEVRLDGTPVDPLGWLPGCLC